MAPKEFELSDLKVSPAPGGNKMHGKFEDGSDTILITYRISTDIAGKVEKEETGVGLFEAGEVSHFIVDNDGNLSVTWAVDGVKRVMNANVATMDVLGVSEIIVYRSADQQSWTKMRTYSMENYPQMVAYNTTSHIDYVTYIYATTGYYYRAYITFYAKTAPVSVNDMSIQKFSECNSVFPLCGFMLP